MNHTDDQIYVTKVLEGDARAFETLVNRYKDFVFTLAIRMTKNREDAEEVSQDTFVKAYKSLQRFKGDSKFSTWLYRIAYNSSLDKLKKQKKNANNTTINEFTEHQIKTLDNALSNLEQKEYEQAIQDCLHQLPAEDCSILTLFYFEDLSLEDISKILNIKPNNVKVKLFRSRKKLATILQNRLEPEIIARYGR